MTLTGPIRPRRNSIGLEQRLATLPRTGLPLQHPVLVHWNTHQVPFIEAQTDRDLAVGLGLVHVHLRWTQMELMRRVAAGRLSEMIGPLGIRPDRALRTAAIAPESVGRFAAALDRALAETNADYAAHRVGMQAPEVVVAPPGAFAAWMRARANGGTEQGAAGDQRSGRDTRTGGVHAGFRAWVGWRSVKRPAPWPCRTSRCRPSPTGCTSRLRRSGAGRRKQGKYF